MKSFSSDGLSRLQELKYGDAQATSSLTIGYNRWQSGLGLEGKEILTTEDLAKLGIGEKEIDARLYKAKE